ncbi:MAG TPA: outer membrane protein transport protein [Verrucomicrobiae bacterium]|nr:outer membrane protein transport protein [Verrucomicrobiae bacterium]
MQDKLRGTMGQRMNHYALAIALTLASAESSWAVGFLLPNQDPEAIGRGDAFTATADNPSAIYYNPAGITQLKGAQVSLGLYGISARTSYASPTGATAHTDANPQFVPQVYATYSFKDLPISAGLGVYAPYGLGVNWGNPPFSPFAQKGKLVYLTANPVAAWQICKMLSVSAGPTFNYSEATFQVDPGEIVHFQGSDWDPGYAFGILFQPHPMWSFGVDYRSETSMNYSGTFGVWGSRGVTTSAEIHFPRTVLGGISFRPTPDWNLEFDLSWTQWSKVNEVTFQNSPFGVPYSLNFDYRDSFIYDFGVTRQLGKGYYASVGYIFSQKSNPNATYNPVDPDANLHLGNFGFGHHGDHLDWAVAYQFAYNGGRTVSGDANPFFDGTYKTFNNAVNASVTVKF